MKNYSHVLNAVFSNVWAIQPEKLQAILGFLEMKGAGLGPSDEVLAEIRAANLEAARRTAAANSSGAVAVLPLYGLISHRTSMMGDISGPGGTSCQQFAKQFRQAMADPSVKAVVFDVDSPGGSVEGVAELADEIYQARGKKPMTAVSDCLMASAAYWLSAACDEIVASPSSQTGSIGVYSAHKDESQALAADGVKVTLVSAGKYKTEGSRFEPLTDEARQAMQDMVDGCYDSFVKSVAKGRGATMDAVRGGYGEGRILSAQSAVKAGLADRVGTLDQVLAGLGVGRGSAQKMAAESLTAARAYLEIASL